MAAEEGDAGAADAASWTNPYIVRRAIKWIRCRQSLWSDRGKRRDLNSSLTWRLAAAQKSRDLWVVLRVVPGTS